MPKNFQIISSSHPPSSMPPSHSYTLTQPWMSFKSPLKPPQNDDDDDICPVCESECTCNKNDANPPPATLQLTPQYIVAATAAAATTTTTTTSQPTAVVTLSAPPQLKIKLPPLLKTSTITKQPSAKRARTKSSKLKQTTVGSATVVGTNIPDDYVFVNTNASSAANTASAFSLRDTSPLTPEPECEPLQHLKKNKLASKPKRPTTERTRKKTTLNGRSRKKSNKNESWTSSASRRKGKRVVQPSSDESDDFTEQDTYTAQMTTDPDGDENLQFPTFISVSAMSDNGDDGATTTTLSDSFDSDSSLRAEEEKLILSQEQRVKVRRELLHNEEHWHMEKRKWDHLKNNNNWEIRPRKRSVSPEETDTENGSDSDSEMEVDDEEEEEGEDDEDDDADGRARGVGMTWQTSEDEDEDFDVELFFATLTDSSGPGSDADAEDSGNETDHSDLSAISVTKATAAGLVRSPAPLVVTEDWDGKLVFSNGLKDGEGVLDVHFEVDAAQRHRSIRQAMELDTGEVQERQQQDGEEEEDQDDLIADDDGETTDDMLDHETAHGVVPLPFRCPTPPMASIDPLSTLSPVVTKRNKFLTNILTIDPPNPADILASNGSRSRSTSVVPSPPGTSVSSQSRLPRMGSFSLASPDPKRSAIIDGTRAVLSPFSRLKRSRRGRDRKRIFIGNDLPHPFKRTRQASLPGELHSTLSMDNEEQVVQSSPELPLPNTSTTTSFGLDDVLDAAFLDSDDSATASATTTADEHFRNLSRWDRIPMGTFRRSRASHIALVHGSVVPSNDGVSYGSAGGHVLRKSPGGAALWQREGGPRKSTPGSVTVSPVIFPVRDGKRTPLAVIEELEFEAESTVVMKPKSHKQKRNDRKKRANALKREMKMEVRDIFEGFSDVPPLKL